MTPRELWSESVGLLPHRVTAFENPAKAGTVYLRWRVNNNWKKKSLGAKLRDGRGRVVVTVRRAALLAAEEQYERLTGKRAPEATTGPALTIEQAWPIVSHPQTGLYPVLTRYAAEVARSLAHAGRIWGASTEWNAIDRAHLRMLGRTRVDEIRARGLTGYRAAEATLGHVLAVAAWLRDEERIAISACVAPKGWKTQLREYWRQVAPPGATPKPQRPRHSLDEMRALLKIAGDVDPRLALLMAFGAELRLGQVRLCRRTDVSAEHKTLTVHDAGHKHGTVVELTRGQWAAWEVATNDGGYLSDLEGGAMADYYLFPAGRLVKGQATARNCERGPIDRSAIRAWFDEAEELAGIAHVAGRGAYGLRRVAVDTAKAFGISREGLKQQGGWQDSHIPDAIYAEQDSASARKEAADIRRRIRGEE